MKEYHQNFICKSSPVSLFLPQRKKIFNHKFHELHELGGKTEKIIREISVICGLLLFLL
jgi:hypothetical protein